jgi:hypothetical protein
LYEQTLKNDQPRKARAHIDAIAQSDPGDSSLPGLRERLANAFLDQADTRLAQDRRGEATSAMKAARELSPTNPRLGPLEAKLQVPQSAATTTPTPAATPNGG